jgi:hypothetical protein
LIRQRSCRRETHTVCAAESETFGPAGCPLWRKAVRMRRMLRRLGTGVFAPIGVFVAVMMLTHHRQHPMNALGTEPSLLWASNPGRRCPLPRGPLGLVAEARDRPGCAGPLVAWLRQQASRRDLDETCRLDLVQTLADVRLVSSGVPLSRSGPWEQRKRLHQLYRDVRAELAELPLPPAIADWVATDFGI